MLYSGTLLTFVVHQINMHATSEIKSHPTTTGNPPTFNSHSSNTKNTKTTTNGGLQ